MQPNALQLMQLAIVSGGFALVGALLGAMISGYFNLRAKRNEYINEYYKKVIDRRMAAYERLEDLIISLKTSIVGEDKKPYHLLFSQCDDGGLLPAYQKLHDVTSQALWLSDAAFKKTREFNQLLWGFNDSGSTPIEFGQKNYQTLANLRENLETLLATDMLAMHDVKRFLKNKKIIDSKFEPWG
jgi:hypothetical protein